MSQPTINGNWKVPLYIFGSAIVSCLSLGSLATLQYKDLKNHVDASVSQQQWQDWIDVQRERNPNVIWSPIPKREIVKQKLEIPAMWAGR